jgi:hypothetical protein
MRLEYNIKVKELDEKTDYPLDTLSGLTGLGVPTIRSLAEQGKFAVRRENGKEVVRGEDFLKWSRSVGHRLEVQADARPGGQ